MSEYKTTDVPPPELPEMLYISIDITKDLYRKLEMALMDKTLGDSIKDPLILIGFHVYLKGKETLGE